MLLNKKDILGMSGRERAGLVYKDALARKFKKRDGKLTEGQIDALTTITDPEVRAEYVHYSDVISRIEALTTAVLEAYYFFRLSLETSRRCRMEIMATALTARMEREGNEELKKASLHSKNVLSVIGKKNYAEGLTALAQESIRQFKMAYYECGAFNDLMKIIDRLVDELGFDFYEYSDMRKHFTKWTEEIAKERTAYNEQVLKESTTLLTLFRGEQYEAEKEIIKKIAIFPKDKTPETPTYAKWEKLYFRTPQRHP